MKKDNLKWYARKRLWCGLPWTFTKYGLSEDRIFVETGLLSTHQMEVRLYRILNIRLDRSLGQRIFGLGTIHLDSSDRDLGSFDLQNIKHSEDVKEMISAQVESERVRNRVSAREFISDNDHDGEPDFDDDHEDYDPDDEAEDEPFS